MNIRFAEPDDLVELYPILEKLHQASFFSGIAIDKLAVTRTFVSMIYYGRGYAKVIEHKGKLSGGLVGVMSPNPLGIMMAQDLFTFSGAGTHILVRDFIRWAKLNECHGVQISDFSSIKRYHKLLKSLGLKKTGLNFTEVF